MFAGLRDTCPTARVAQPLRFGQIGFAALQFGGPFRHLRLEFVAGSAKLLLALMDHCLGTAVGVDQAGRPKCRCGMIGGHGEQQLIDFGRKLGTIRGRFSACPTVDAICKLTRLNCDSTMVGLGDEESAVALGCRDGLVPGRGLGWRQRGEDLLLVTLDALRSRHHRD
jgi:hypothetical protein